MADAISAATIAAVDRHLAHLGLYPRSDSAGLAPVAQPPPRRTGVVDPTAHSSAPVRYSVAAPAPLQYTSAGLAPVAQPPPRRTGVVDPTTHSSAPVQYSAAAPAPLQYTSAGLAPVAQPPPPTDGCCGPHHTLLRPRTVLCCGPCSLTVHFRGPRPSSSAPSDGRVLWTLPRTPPLPYSTLLHCSPWLRPLRRFSPPPLRRSGGKRQPLPRPISRLFVARAALQPLAPATSAVFTAPTVSQRRQTPAPATANLATCVAHAALQPPPPATSRFHAPPLRPCGP